MHGPQTRQTALLLYKEGISQKEIARMMGVNGKTISDWKKQDKWDERVGSQQANQQIAEQITWELLVHNLRTLQAKIAEWTKNGETRLIEKGDVDAVSKLYASVKGKQVDWQIRVRVSREFAAFVESRDIELAKQLVPQIDAFIAKDKIDA